MISMNFTSYFSFSNINQLIFRSLMNTNLFTIKSDIEISPFVILKSMILFKNNMY